MTRPKTARSAPPFGTIFALQTLDFFYTLGIQLNMLNEMLKILENQGLEPLSKPLSNR
jgi:hypothetical protein